ncbi:MAG: ABC transporter ATP-binding protein [Alphaproteobacteria bacterium]|nr:ABC transporter ATP-binding protein [Alphaproteobacteria bacterium]
MNLTKLIFTNIKKLKHLFIPYALSFILASIALSITPYVTSKIINCFSIETKTLAIDSILFWFILFIILKVLQAINQYFLSTIKVDAESTFTSNITLEMFNHVHHHNTRYFDDEMTGRISTAITSASNTFNYLSMDLLFGLIRPIINFIFAFSIIANSCPKLALTIIILSIPFYLIIKKLGKTIHNLWATRGKLEKDYVAFNTDSITNYKLVKYTGSIFSEKINAFKILKKYLHSTYECENNRASSTFILEFTETIFTISCYFAIIYFAIYDNLNLGLAYFSFSAINMLLSELGNLSRVSTSFFQNLGELKSNIDLIFKPIEIKDKENAYALKIKSPSIEYQDITFSYIKEKEVFKNLNISIKPYQKIGLVGSSGSGKSSLINLLLRSYTPQKGKILIDNHDISDITEFSLHKNISYVPQDVTLFNRSLLENLKITKPKASNDEIINACKLAHIHDTIMGLKNGYDSIVGERGILLSGGERQRIAIARAILQDAPILILDEATSALDSEAEFAIQQALSNLMNHKTVIAIAHRLSTLRSMDRIIVLDNGKIIEDDTPQNLLKKKKGVFKHFYSLQADGYLNFNTQKGDK